MESGKILRLRGLPWSATEEDVRGFLEGLEVATVYLCRRGGGIPHYKSCVFALRHENRARLLTGSAGDADKLTGEAFVEFASTEDAATALSEKNHQNLGERYIEIFVTDALSMADITADTEEQETGYVVRLRGLPYSATSDEVVGFFEPHEVVGGSEGVIFTFARDGRPMGEAYVEFPSEEVQTEALKYHKNKLGPRYVELFVSNKADMQTAIQQNKYHTLRQGQDVMGGRGFYSGGGRGRGGVWGGLGRGRGRGRGQMPTPPLLPLMPPPEGAAGVSDGSTLRLRGLPYSATVEDVTEFFSGFSLGPDAIQIATKPSRDGGTQGTGMAFVHFASPAEADSARTAKHRATMGTRYIECLPLYSAARFPYIQGPPPLGGLPPGMMGRPLTPGPGGFLAGPGPLHMPLGGFPPQPHGLRPPHAGVPAYEGLSRLRPRGPGGRIPYAMGAQPVPGGRPTMVGPVAMGPHFDPRLRPPLMGPAGQPPPPSGRPPKTNGRGGERRMSSPGVLQQPPGTPPPGPQAGPSGQMSAEFQQQQQQQHQQMLMQQHYLMQQQMVMHQQQAMGHIRHPGWGVAAGPGMAPLGGPYMGGYGAGVPGRPPFRPLASRPGIAPPTPPPNPGTPSTGSPGGQPAQGGGDPSSSGYSQFPLGAYQQFAFSPGSGQQMPHPRLMMNRSTSLQSGKEPVAFLGGSSTSGNRVSPGALPQGGAPTPATAALAPLGDSPSGSAIAASASEAQSFLE